MDSASEIALDVSPCFRIHKDGSVERLKGTLTVSASEEEHASVASRDVILDPHTGVYVRIFLPRAAANRGATLPVLLYIHGGGFCIESAASPTYHNYLNKMANLAEVVCVSVDYRRGPEHRLPAAYDDCFLALQWLRNQAECPDGAADPWLRSHADFAQCFIAGDSAGANIVHNLGIRAGPAWGGSDGGGLRIRGAILVHPFFGGKDRIGGEWVPPHRPRLLKACLPEGEDEDYCGFNPAAPRSPAVSALLYPRLLVAVAEKDDLKERGLWYHDTLSKSSGKRVELLMTEDEGHVFHLKDLHCKNARSMMKRISDFIHARDP